MEWPRHKASGMGLTAIGEIPGRPRAYLRLIRGLRHPPAVTCETMIWRTTWLPGTQSAGICYELAATLTPDAESCRTRVYGIWAEHLYHCRSSVRPPQSCRWPAGVECPAEPRLRL